MKKLSRLLCLLLALVMCVGILAACGGDDPEDTTKAPGTTKAPTSSTAPTTTAAPGGTTPGDDTTASGGDSTASGTAGTDWASLDFSGTNVVIGYLDYINPSITATGAGNSLSFLRGPDEIDGEIDLSRADYKAAYDRHEKVCAALNLNRVEDGGTLDKDHNFKYEMVQWRGTEKIIDDITTYNLNKDKNTPTIMIHHNYGMVRAGIQGQLHNALRTDVVNYFNLDNEHWYKDMMLENTIDQSKVYMLLGDYFIDQFRMAFGVLFNVDEIDQLLIGGIDELYDIVEGGEWTYDMMMEIAGDGYTGEQSSELVMGVIGEQGWVVRSFFATSGLDIFKRDANGEAFYIEGEEIDPVFDFVEKIKSMENEDFFSYNWPNDPRNNRTAVPTTFVNGGAVFALNQMVLSFEGKAVLNMADKASIVPNPKYVAGGDEYNDLETNYKALVSDNAGGGGIMRSATAAQFTAASAFLQMMTEESGVFFEKYYEEGLKYTANQISRRHNDMLDYIHNGICAPMSFYYDNYCSKNLGDETKYQTYGKMMYICIDDGAAFNRLWDSQLGAKISEWADIKANYGHPND